MFKMLFLITQAEKCWSIPVNDMEHDGDIKTVMCLLVLINQTN